MTTRPARRGLMYGVVGAQLVVLAAIVAPEELNRALDAGPAVEVEIVHARAARDPFRGAYVVGESGLDLDGRSAVLPADGLRHGERVLVTFAVGPNGARIKGVERGRRATPFTATSFSVPGRVLGPGDRPYRMHREGRLIAAVGTPPVSIALDLRASIAVDDAALARLAGPGLVRASLHAGFLGRPYFTDVRLSGRAWPPDVRFAYDDTRERLLVLAPRDTAGRAITAGALPLTDLFVFDAAGRELAASEVQGRVIDAVGQEDGHLLALVSDRWAHSEVSLARLGPEGQVLQRSAPLVLDRVLGFDAAASGVWVLVAPTSSSRPQPSHFIQRVTVAGIQSPALGPFESSPRGVVARGAEVWVVETERHRVTRLDATTGRTLREYRDLTGPSELAVDGAGAYVIEANRTQLTRLADDGSVAWRVSGFRELAWAVPEPGTGGGWVGASMFEGATAGVLRFGAGGAITRVAATAKPAPPGGWRRRIGPAAIRSARDGRLVLLEPEAIAILSADGATIRRVPGFRFKSEPRLRS